MNDFEKAVSEGETVIPTPASIEAASSESPVQLEEPEVCAENESPALAIAEVTEENQSEVCSEPESPSLDIAEVAENSSEARLPNYFAMGKEELLEALKEILNAGNMEAHKEVAVIKQAFFNIRNKEALEEVNAYVEAGNAPESFSSVPDECEIEFKKLFTEFKEKRSEYIAAEEAKKKENLERKLAILSELKKISEDIDTVNARFSDFQQLQQEFKAIKDIPAQSETETWKEFQIVSEKFYDHLKMNKELRDLDFKKNLEAKRALIEEAQILEKMSDPIAAFRKLQTLHEEWRNIGPVAKELREGIWDEFKEASTIINKRHQDYFEQRKAAELENEIAKTKLCEEVEAIDVATLKSFHSWNEATDKVIEIQKRWKEYGFASKKANAALYSRFRKACDVFFESKTAYFQKTKDEFSENLAKKTALCEKAESLKELGDINKAADEVVKLQAEWKKIGAVPRKQSDAIWQRFQTACNYFFIERKKQSNARRQEENNNLEAKRNIITRLKELPLDGDRKEVIGKVKDLQAEWQKVGFVPFKHKDKIYTEYREVVDALYNSYEAKENKARMNNFQERVNDLRNDSRQLGRERDRLVRAYESRRNEIKTIENNMCFFNVKSSAGNSMLREMENKVNRLKEDMKQIEEKISILDSQE